MELVTVISTVLILLVGTTGTTTMISISQKWKTDVTWSMQEMPMTTIDAATTSSVTTNERLVSTTDQKYGINATFHDTALVSSRKQISINTSDTWQTATPTASSVTTNQRWEISLGMNGILCSLVRRPFTSYKQAKITDSSFVREVIYKGIWKIEWPEFRAGLVFGGVAVPLTVLITILIIWKRGGSLYTCMRLGRRLKEEETIDLAQLNIALNESHL